MDTQPPLPLGHEALNRDQFLRESGQLAMFMSGSELKRLYHPDDHIEIAETRDQMWKRKIQQAKVPAESAPPGTHGAGVMTAVRKGRIETPVTVYYASYSDHPDGSLFDGHHRTASAAYLDETEPLDDHRYLPVEHRLSYDDVQRHTAAQRKINAAKGRPVPKQRNPEDRWGDA